MLHVYFVCPMAWSSSIQGALYLIFNKASRATQSFKSIDLRVRFKFLSGYEPTSLSLNLRTANLTPFLPIGFTPLVLQNNPQTNQYPWKPYLLTLDHIQQQIQTNLLPNTHLKDVKANIQPLLWPSIDPYN
jgi:hypothetical protein